MYLQTGLRSSEIPSSSSPLLSPPSFPASLLSPLDCLSRSLHPSSGRAENFTPRLRYSMTWKQTHLIAGRQEPLSNSSPLFFPFRLFWLVVIEQHMLFRNGTFYRARQILRGLQPCSHKPFKTGMIYRNMSSI